jgi:hypothetical protein
MEDASGEWVVAKKGYLSADDLKARADAGRDATPPRPALSVRFFMAGLDGYMVRAEVGHTHALCLTIFSAWGIAMGGRRWRSKLTARPAAPTKEDDVMLLDCGAKQGSSFPSDHWETGAKQCSLAPGNSSVITAQSLVVSRPLLAFPGS